MKKFKCSVCQYVHDGENPPDKCPRCQAPKEKFVALSADQSKLVDRSRVTNALHVDLAKALEKARAIAESGIKDSLDPACVAVFTKAKNEAELLMQFIKAEIEVHVGKGKWG